MTTVADWTRTLMIRGLPRESAEQVVLMALNNGALVETGPASTYDALPVAGDIPPLMIQAEILRRLPSGLVATAPLAEAGTEIRETRVVFALIIAAAEYELRLASPFLDDKGVMMLEAQFRAAVQRGLKLRLLSRELKIDYSRSSKELIGPLARERGIRKLAGWFGNQMQVRDYYMHDGTRQVAALHAKIIQADDVIGYVGSADVREYALKVNFEMGYVFHANDAAVCRAAFEAFWNSATANPA